MEISEHNSDGQTSQDEDEELKRMRSILDQMVECSATEYDQYPNVLANKESLSDDLIVELLNEYLCSSPKSEDESCELDEDGDLVLETDHDPAHLQVIAEVENGTPMQIDRLPTKSKEGTKGRTKKVMSSEFRETEKRTISKQENCRSSTRAKPCTIPPQMLSGYLYSVLRSNNK